MRYTGSSCGRCGETFHEHDEVVVCPRCGTPEHKNCWAETQNCTNENKHEEGYIWQKSNHPPANTEPSINHEAEGSSIQTPFEKQNQGPGQACPNCNTINDPAEPVCINCSQRIYLAPSAAPNAYNQQQDPPSGGGFNQAYNAPNIEIDGIPAQEVAAYVQQHADSYIAKFLYMDKKGTENSFNWAAGLFPHLWFFYRKMYKTGLLVMGALLLTVLISLSPAKLENAKRSIEILESAYGSEISFQQALEEIENLPAVNKTIFDYLSFALAAALRIFLALRADSIYRKKVVKDILKSREEAHDKTSYFYLLFKKGGGSIGAMIGSIFIYLVADFAIEYLAVFFLS